MPRRAKIYVNCVIAAGSAIGLISLSGWRPGNLAHWAIYLVLTLAASLVKLRLPGYEGTFSLNYLFLLYGVTHFTLPQTAIAAVAGALVQSFGKASHHPKRVQVVFNAASLVVTIGACFGLVHLLEAAGFRKDGLAAAAAVASTYFIVNTLLVSVILSLIESKRLGAVWEQWYAWLLPYYLVGVASLVWASTQRWAYIAEFSLVLLPLLYLIHFFLGLVMAGPLDKKVKAEADASGLAPAAHAYLVCVIAGGIWLLVVAAGRWDCANLTRFFFYLSLALIASTLKVKLPGLTSTISIGFVPLLVAITEQSLAESAIIAAAQAVVQCLWRPKRRPTSIQVVFNVATLALSAALASFVANRAAADWLMSSSAARLIVAAVILYVSNTTLVTIMICLAARTSLMRLWQHWHYLSFPYYLVGASIAGVALSASGSEGWQGALLVFPVMVLIYVSYRMHVWGPERSA